MNSSYDSGTRRGRTWLMALACAALLAGAHAHAQGSCAGGKVSKQTAKPLQAALDALKAKQWNTALAKAREAQAVPSKNAFDVHTISEIRGFVYSQTNRYPDAERELAAGLRTGCMAEADKPARYKALAQINARLRNHAKVIEYGNLALKSGGNGDMAVLVGQSYYQNNDFRSALRVLNDVVTAQERRGQKPDEQILLMIRSACARLDDKACVTRQFEKLVLNYPNPDYWQNLIYSLARSDLDDRQQLNVMRLATHVNAMNRPDQFTEMAQLALEAGLPGEAQAVLEKAFAKKVFPDKREIDRNQRLLDAARAKAVTDKVALAREEPAAKAAASGVADVELGAAFLSFGEHAKAAAALQRGIGKGDIKDRDEAYMLLGLAHLRAGNRAEAAKAFRAVKTDPTMARIAKLWLLNT